MTLNYFGIRRIFAPFSHDASPLYTSFLALMARISLRSTDSLVVHSSRTPNSWFTPTQVNFASHSGDKSASPRVAWQSRRARKGRYAPKSSRIHHGTSTEGDDSVQEVVARTRHAETHMRWRLYPDISFWVAFTFTFGSAVWVVNGFLVWLPILRPHLATETFATTAAALAFLGGTIFLLGSYLMVVEALDRGREIQFGTALGNLLHHQRHQASFQAYQDKVVKSGNDGGDQGPASQGKRSWIWWGKPLWHDMGYLAAVIQLGGAVIFWISTLTGLPGVIPGFAAGEGSTAIIDVFFWSPQVVGGMGFILSSSILMLEVQRRWYVPNLTDIGWHIGFWNLIGSIGFTLCGALGYSSSDGAVYQSGLSTWWGSWAFLFGSTIQIGEAIYREPPA